VPTQTGHTPVQPRKEIQIWLKVGQNEHIYARAMFVTKLVSRR
jgi:hypothetical protein